MRLLIGIAALGVLVSVGQIQAQTPGAGKVNTQWKCAAPNPAHALPVGDAPDHAYVVQQISCTATRGAIAGVNEKDGVAVEFAEGKGDNATGHGIFIATLASGDKVMYSYTFSATSKNKALVSGSNKWTITGGTGKFKGITGSGTCTAKSGADGSAMFDCTGAYTAK